MLKENSKRKGISGFSLNGPKRNVGYVGQNMRFSKNGTPFRGIYPRGSGGIGGTYSANGSGSSYITSVNISQLPSPNVIVAGGGGCGSNQYGGYAGLGTGGSIGDSNNGVNGNNGAAYGSGGGGGGGPFRPNPFTPYTCGNGGNGGNGIVIVYW